MFTFIRTDVESPADIDQSCLTIDNSTLGTKYLGKQLCFICLLILNKCELSAYMITNSDVVATDLETDFIHLFDIFLNMKERIYMSKM